MSARERRTGRAAASGPGAPPRPIDAGERERIRRAFLALALAHELRQPLNSLNLNVALLMTRLAPAPGAPPGADVEGPLSALGRVADRVVASLDAYCERVGPEAVPDEPRELRPIVEDAVERARRAARRGGVRLALDWEQGAVTLAVHPAQLIVALDGLLARAIEVTPRGGRVALQVAADADEVRLAVADGGPPLPPAARSSSLPVEGGVDARLEVAKLVAYHHGGRFQLQAAPEAGSIVTMLLPL